MTRARDSGCARTRPVADLDWPAGAAALSGARAVDLWEEFLDRLPELPVDHGMAAADVAARRREAAAAPDDLEHLLADTRSLMLEWSMYPGHGGFRGYVSGAGTIPGASADLRAPGPNNNAGGWRLSPGSPSSSSGCCAGSVRALGFPPPRAATSWSTTASSPATARSGRRASAAAGHERTRVDDRHLLLRACRRPG